jgi:hypothetical protein
MFHSFMSRLNYCQIPGHRNVLLLGLPQKDRQIGKTCYARFHVVMNNVSMKKRLTFLPLLAGMVCLLPLACSNKSIDTAKVRAAFASVAGAPKQQLDEALGDIEASNYVAAVEPLRRVAYSVKMNATQRKLLEDTMAKVKAKAAAQK